MSAAEGRPTSATLGRPMSAAGTMQPRPGGRGASVAAEPVAGERALWKVVAIPSEHGGWGLTLEPVLLGLLVAPSVAGGALAVAAFLAFLVRTPLKLAAVDARRDRWLARSRLALRVTIAELVLLAGAVAVAVAASGLVWVPVVAIAAPFVLVELWFDVRSRGRRLLPELCGAIGISGVAAAIVLAAGRGAALAAGLWVVLAARSVGAIPFVRVQIGRMRRGLRSTRSSDLAQVLAVGLGGLAVVLHRSMIAGLAGLVVLGALQLAWVRRPPVAPKQLGMRLMVLGVALVLVTAAGTWF